MKFLAFAGRFALFLAVMSFLTCVSLFVGGAYLATWPVLRISPRNRRLQSLVGLATAIVTVVRAYDLDTRAMKDATGDTEDTENVDEGGETDSHTFRERHPSD